jgi:hypothetical protein
LLFLGKKAQNKIPIDFSEANMRVSQWRKVIAVLKENKYQRLKYD